jgi:membrane protein YqaA with SNARE-associated domain
MDHHERHHQQKEKEHEQKAHERKLHEQAAERGPRSLHPAWYIVMGVVVCMVAALTWTFFIR